MTSLDVSGMTSLTYLDCAPTDSYTGTKLTSLDVSGCTNLETLLCYNTNIYSLSVDDCTNLKTLNCHNCPNLTSQDAQLPQLPQSDAPIGNQQVEPCLAQLLELHSPN